MLIFPNFLSEALGQIKSNTAHIEKSFNKNYDEIPHDYEEYFGKMSIIFLRDEMYPNVSEEKIINTRNLTTGKFEKMKVLEI